MERGTGPDAGRVSQHARFDLAFVDDMAEFLARRAKELGVSRLRVVAQEKTDSGASSLLIEIEMQASEMQASPPG